MRLLSSIMSISWLSLIVFYTTSGQAASFDCKKATGAVKTTICRNEFLSKLDDEMANVYVQALVLTPDRDVLKKEQRDWVKTYLNKCKSVECLKSHYVTRIEELKSYTNSNNYHISDTNLIGKWEPYSTAFYKTGIIKITPDELFHESCKSKFRLIRNEGAMYYFESKQNGTCHFITYEESVNYIKIILNKEDISVRYYSGLTEPTLLGEGTYSKVK